jgi:hypothetical protein
VRRPQFPEDAALSNLRRIDVFNASHTPHNDNQHNRKAHNGYCANCHNVICNKVSILEVVPRHPHSFEPPRNYRCPGMNDEAPISRLVALDYRLEMKKLSSKLSASEVEPRQLPDD